MEIPHLEMRWDYRIRRENCLVNLYPHPSVLSRVIFHQSLNGIRRNENDDFGFLLKTCSKLQNLLCLNGRVSVFLSMLYI